MQYITQYRFDTIAIEQAKKINNKREREREKKKKK